MVSNNTRRLRFLSGYIMGLKNTLGLITTIEGKGSILPKIGSYKCSKPLIKNVLSISNKNVRML